MMEPRARLIYLHECDSTNSELARLCAEGETSNGLTVRCHTQNRGRGQRGNSWEAEPGANLTFSTLLRPEGGMEAARQFELSMLVSLAITDTLERYGVAARIKWPNDIYAGADGKLCGILIENTLGSGGRVLEQAIVGVGLNVNQLAFHSDAPNPVSMRGITGKEYALEPLLETLTSAMLDALRLYKTRGEEGTQKLRERYLQRLWRGDGGLYPFRQTSDGSTFMARIADVRSDGTLILEDSEGGERKYLFKEVEFLLK